MRNTSQTHVAAHNRTEVDRCSEISGVASCLASFARPRGRASSWRVWPKAVWVCSRRFASSRGSKDTRSANGAKSCEALRFAAACALSLADFLRGGSLGAPSPLAGRFLCCASLAARRAGAPVVAAAALDFFLAILGPLGGCCWLGACAALFCTPWLGCSGLGT
jgi:hypothetical protein